ncbi:SRPBCC family protein [Actinoplanes sp. NBRC 103695]|uniref:SRPBCC family protein n=1 Tax=Actinoplanes sp. NBRC 103695 TaxID=3032202 RepID=UPI0024A1E7C2|nr:SRPBCC family protein [Actinoplanes sp. NBRC 103695]GLY92939.1 polyketide cyclase [Actinoplanes sp. NBRC 103695]
MESKHVSTHIDRPLEAVYEYASDPANLPAWAPGLLSSIERDGDHWVAESPMGRIELVFTPRNEYGVLDHDVTTASGETFHNPMRVIPDGDGCELVFTVRRRPEMSDEDFERDWKAVLEDLVAIKRIVEG